MFDKLTKVTQAAGRELSEEETNIILWLENAKNDSEIIERAKTIKPEDYYGPIMAACRRRAGLSQEQLGELLFCNASSISKYENNITNLGLEFFYEWGVATKSQDAMVSFLYMEIGVVAMVKKLKDTGWFND